MKKIYLSAVLGIALLLVMSSFVIAVKPASTYTPYAKNNGQAGKSDMNHLYLVEKDANWVIIPDGALGKMAFDDENFVFNGHGLENKDYTLVRYEGDAWAGVECLASGTANKGGNLNLAGSIGTYGDKVWLVLTSDVDCTLGAQKMIGWNPSEYLFEYDLI